MLRKSKLTVLLFLCFHLPAFALDPNYSISQYVHDVWTSDQGLPANTITSLVQSPDGYLWLGTQEGLVRFDGVRFVIFDRSNTEQIQNNRVTALLVDRTDALWAGTEAGLLRLRNSSFTLFTTKDGLCSNEIRSLYEAANGTIWIGTEDGLSLLTGKTFISYTTREGLSNGAVTSFAEDTNGSMWIGTRNGLFESNAGKLIRAHPAGLLSESILSMKRDRMGALWIGTSSGLNRILNGNLAGYTVSDGLSDNYVLCLLQDRDGSLWIGTRGGGLNRFRDNQFASYTMKDGLSNNFVGALGEDHEGSLWIGNWGGGLNRLNEGKFATVATGEGATFDSVSSFLEARDGSLWIGTYTGGISRLKQGAITKYTSRQGLADDIIYTLYEDESGVLWVGTRSGLCEFKNETFQCTTTEAGLPNVIVFCLLGDPAGGVWIGSREGGLSRFNNGKYVKYTAKEGLRNDNVYTMRYGNDGTLWIGTRAGLFNEKNGAFTLFSTENGLSSDFILSLFPDREGTLWIGTNGGGLNRYSAGKFDHFTKKDGLFDDVVNAILDDDQNNLWLSSNKGIFRVRKDELDSFAKGKTNGFHSVAYGKADGMRIQECNSGQNAALRAKDGKLWFATLKGAVVVDPNNIKMNRVPPPVIIEKVIVDGETIPTDGISEIQLSPEKKRIEFEYTGLSYFAPERVRFKYQLEGFDKEWVDAGTRRTAYFTNIPHGKYRFRVIACNSDGFWNEKGALFLFSVQPHFYQTAWFYALSALTILAIAIASYRLRLRRLKASFAAVLAERTRISRNLHDTLAQSLSGILMQLDAADSLANDSERSGYHVLRARNLARDTLEEARRTVWQLRPESRSAEDLAALLTRIANELNAADGPQVHVRVNGVQPELSSSVKEELAGIAQEAIRNAIRHAKAQSIQVELNSESNHLHLSVRDDGSGFDASAAPTAQTGHFGITGMRERAAQLGAKFKIESQPGTGTRVLVSVSL